MFSHRDNGFFFKTRRTARSDDCRLPTWIRRVIFFPPTVSKTKYGLYIMLWIHKPLVSVQWRGDGMILVRVSSLVPSGVKQY